MTETRSEVRLRAALGMVVVGLVGVALPACSDLKPGDETGELVFKLNTQDALPANFACLNDPPAPPAPPPTQPGFSYTAFVPDYRNPLISVPATARSCSMTDAVCNPGISQGVMVPPPQPGYPAGFGIGLPAAPIQTFIRLSAAGYPDFDYYVKGPMVENVVATQPFSMVSRTSLGEFISGLGADPMQASDLGVLALIVFDCFNDPAPNVALRLTTSKPPTPEVVPFAIQDHIPVAGRRTDESGIAGFVNVPLENVTVEAEIEGRFFGSRSFPIQADHITSGTVRTNYDKGY